jgi:glucosamine-phosphate N-acetyltransferase
MDSTKYLIRKVNKEDYYKGHLELYKQLTSIQPEIINKDDYEAFISKLTDDHVIFVIYDLSTDMIIGSATILIENKLIHNLSLVGHIEDVVIDNKYRNQNLGKSLIEYTVNFAKDRKCYKTILSTSDKTKEFYKKCNFIEKSITMAIYFE